MSKWLLAIFTSLPLLAADNSFLIRNATIHPVSGPQLENGSLLVLEGRIAGIGAKIASPKGVKVIEAKGLHVYPGLIDSGSQIGLSEIGSVRETQDVAELGEFNPQLRSIVAVNPESDHIPVTRVNGITSALIVPGSLTRGGRFGGANSVIGGQASMIRLNGWTWEDMEVRRSAVMQMTFPTISPGTFDTTTFQFRRGNFGEAKRQYEQQLQRVRSFFEEARRYQTAKKVGQPDLKVDRKLEAMLPVLEGKLPLFVIAQRERAIRDAIEFASRENVKIILAGVRRPGRAVELIAQKQIPVVLDSPMELPAEEDDPYDEAFTLPAILHKAGIKFAFGSFGNQFARNLPYEASQAIAFGLPAEVGLRAVTLNAAEIFGVAAEVGSLEKGKVADLMVTDGDPLEIRTQIRMLFIKGEPVDLETRHTRLYKKYLARP